MMISEKQNDPLFVFEEGKENINGRYIRGTQVREVGIRGTGRFQDIRDRLVFSAPALLKRQAETFKGQVVVDGGDGA